MAEQRHFIPLLGRASTEVRPQKWARLTSRSQMTSITVAIMTKGRRFGVVRRFFSPNHFFRLHNGCCAGISKNTAFDAIKEFGCSGGVSRTRSIAPLSDWEGRQRGAFFRDTYHASWILFCADHAFIECPGGLVSGWAKDYWGAGGVGRKVSMDGVTGSSGNGGQRSGAFLWGSAGASSVGGDGGALCGSTEAVGDGGGDWGA